MRRTVTAIFVVAPLVFFTIQRLGGQRSDTSGT
jgi:hypothetical protein